MIPKIDPSDEAAATQSDKTPQVGSSEPTPLGNWDQRGRSEKN